MNSDFKSGRVKDPTKIDEKHEKKVKKYCKDFFDKAAYKHRKLEKDRAERKQKPETSRPNGMASAAPSTPVLNLDASPDTKKEGQSDDEDVKMSDDDEEKTTPRTPLAGMNEDGLKRKRAVEEDEAEEEAEDNDDDIKAESDMSKSPAKRIKSESPPPPPPPPEPPIDTPPPIKSEERAAVQMANHQLHADTSFAEKSMADVLAEAQQDGGDGDESVDNSMPDVSPGSSDNVKNLKQSPTMGETVENGRPSSR